MKGWGWVFGGGVSRKIVFCLFVLWNFILGHGIVLLLLWPECIKGMGWGGGY